VKGGGRKANNPVFQGEYGHVESHEITLAQL